jgi:hypothetical protein
MLNTSGPCLPFHPAMTGLVPPSRAEALFQYDAAIATAGEGPAIQVLLSRHKKDVDAGDKRGHNGGEGRVAASLE